MTNIIDVIAPVEQEGTKAIVKSWYISAGQKIAEGDPLVELETDKVAVEVPAPASGILSEIIIDADGEAEPGAVLGKLIENGVLSDSVTEDGPALATKEKDRAPEDKSRPISENTIREHRLSPAVRRLVHEHALAPSLIEGTGKDGRLTRGDVQEFLKRGEAHAPTVSHKAPAAISNAVAAKPVKDDIGEAQRIPHDNMRRRIAEHMSHSVQTAPHVTAVFEADFSAILAHRRAHKVAFAKKNVRLTFTAYMIAASVEAMKVAPAVNSRWHQDFLDVYADVNIGVGVALGDKGLIVPVVKHAQSKTLFDIAKDLHDLTEKARVGKLAPADVRGGTFSISNHGTSGSLVAAPIIINQPQSAILGVGKLEKRVVVRTVDGADAIQIRPMAFVSLTIDHRVLDGAQTNGWLTRFVEAIENWPAD